MLTVQQLVVIETQSSVFPLHVGDLHKKFGLGPLSLRSIISRVEAQKATFFVQVRDASILKNVTSPALLQTVWNQSTPSKATLTQLSQILSSIGGSIVYLSRNRQTVGITGTTTSLVGLPCRVLDFTNFKDGVVNVATGIGGTTAVIATLLGASGPVGLGLFITGIISGFAFGAIAGVGIFDLVNANPAASLPPPEPIELPGITVYGELPPDMSVDKIIDLPPIDMGTIPEIPDPPFPPFPDNPGF